MKIKSSLVRTVAYEKGLTQKEISKKTGLSVYAVFQAFNDKSIRESTASKICNVLGLELKDVVVWS